MAYIGQSITEGTRRAHTYTATAGQTTFNAVYSWKRRRISKRNTVTTC